MDTFLRDFFKFVAFNLLIVAVLLVVIGGVVYMGVDMLWGSSEYRDIIAYLIYLPLSVGVYGYYLHRTLVKLEEDEY